MLRYIMPVMLLGLCHQLVASLSRAVYGLLWLVAGAPSCTSYFRRHAISGVLLGHLRIACVRVLIRGVYTMLRLRRYAAVCDA